MKFSTNEFQCGIVHKAFCLRVFPGMAKPLFKKEKTHDKNGLQVTRLETIVHVGTHVDSPLHVISDGEAISEISLDKLIGKAVVLDLKYKAPGEIISTDDMTKYADEVKKGDIVIFNTGYEHYFVSDQHCILAPDAALWLVDHEIKCLAVDIPSLDPISRKNGKASDQTHPSHHIVLGAGIPLVECLTNLDSLTQKKVFFCCLPLKISYSEGAPARAICIEFD